MSNNNNNSDICDNAKKDFSKGFFGTLGKVAAFGVVLGGAFVTKLIANSFGTDISIDPFDLAKRTINS